MPIYLVNSTKMDYIFDYVALFSIYEWILGAVMLFFFLILLCYNLTVYRRPYRYALKKEDICVDNSSLPSISVIISSKNDSEQLEKNLPFILEQNYPNFEVIVINCGSSDETDTVLKAAAHKYPRLYHTFIPAETDDINEKKLALTIGIKAAKNDILLFTESYCKPCSSEWIMEFGKQFTLGKNIILGFSNVLVPKGIICRNFIRYDNLIHHIKFLSRAISGKPFMGSGRNMAYRKELFFNNKGFSSILGIDGGEDDLFINRISNKQNTGVVVSAESMTETDSIENLKSWKSLKSKHLYTKQLYKGFSSLFFGFENFSKYVFTLLLLASLVTGLLSYNYILLAFTFLLFIIKFLVRFSVINKNSKYFTSEKINIQLLLFDLMQPISNQCFTKYANNRNRAIMSVRKWYK